MVWEILGLAMVFLAYAIAITVYVVGIKSANILLKQRVDEMEKWRDRHEMENKESIQKLADEIKQGFEKQNHHIEKLNMLLAKNLNIDVSEIIN